jgi:hypothetical protein
MQPAIVYDLRGETGVEQIITHGVRVLEMLERDPARYVRELPKGKTLGPKQGINKIVLL